MEEKANQLIDHRKMGDRGLSELALLMNSLPCIKAEKKQKTLRDQYFATNKYTYDLPPMIIWNRIELKLQLDDLSKRYGISGNMEADGGNGFSYAVATQFPTLFLAQVLRSQFAYVDGVPQRINPRHLAKKNIQKVLQRNIRKYGKTTGANTLLEMIEIKKEEEAMDIEYLNSIERSLF